MYRNTFRAVGYPLRLYSGRDALENLLAELKRNRAKRAFVVCGRSVSRKTDLIDRIRRIAGDSLAGVFDEMEKESPLPSVQAAADAARAVQADLLIGVGAGSVIQATRVVAILLAETRPVHELITQYPENAPAISPKLMAPKVPIVNVLTAATSAQNRGGSAVKDPADLSHRMEFFDPKTRPVAVFWDSDALLTAPPSLARANATSVLWRSIMNLGAKSMTPLVEGDRLQAYRLARGAFDRLDDPHDAEPRIELCAAAFLQNRDADDGGNMMEKHWVARVVYAFATALFNLHAHISQGHANAALTPHVMRFFGDRDPEAMARIAETLGAWRQGDSLKDAHLKAADAMEQMFTGFGVPNRLSDMDVPRTSLEIILENSMRNFNADPKREFLNERDLLAATLDASW